MHMVSGALSGLNIEKCAAGVNCAIRWTPGEWETEVNVKGAGEVGFMPEGRPAGLNDDGGSLASNKVGACPA